MSPSSHGSKFSSHLADPFARTQDLKEGCNLLAMTELSCQQIVDIELPVIVSDFEGLICGLEYRKRTSWKWRRRLWGESRQSGSSTSNMCLKICLRTSKGSSRCSTCLGPSGAFESLHVSAKARSIFSRQDTTLFLVWRRNHLLHGNAVVLLALARTGTKTVLRILTRRIVALVSTFPSSSSLEAGSRRSWCSL
jgi:hypothetical protein